MEKASVVLDVLDILDILDGRKKEDKLLIVNC